MARETKEINIVTMGCSKNLVDSERLMKMLADVGYKAVHEPKRPKRGSITVVNTCGFIGDAKEESVNEILRWAKARKDGRISRLIVMGCLSERYREELATEIPEIDKIYGKTDWPGIISDLAHTSPATAPYDRVITTPRHHAYLKIAEGCNRFCAFCAIPLITGRYRSRSIEEIVSEAELLVSRGVKELNVIAQELTAYGIDLYGERRLAQLIDRLAQVEGVEWIRLHYAYPTDFPEDVLDAMVRNKNVCKYLDIALQHVSDNVLANMRRHITGDETRRLLKTIRERVPGIHIRTTLMVGFPGEGDKEFEELKEFVREQRFDRMGAFAYCEEEDTYGAKHFDDAIPPEVKQQRLDELMAIQEEIALELNTAKIGREMKVIIDREEADYYVGRSEFDSPEVDPEILIEKTRRLNRGDFCNVKITGAMPYELMATPLTLQH